MISPQDLRIGNIVRLRDTGEIIRVAGLDHNQAMCGRKWGRCMCNFDEIEGVLIYDHWQNIECCGLMHSGWDDGDEKYLYTLANYPNRTFRYIHELQNLHYALTGKELRIEI